MKRKGFLLLEALISLFILTSLALSIVPLATETARVIDSLARRGRLSSEALSVSDYMTEKIRNGRRMAQAPVSGDRYTYYDLNERDVEARYTFYIDREKLKLLLYNGLSEPVTGEKTGTGETIIFSPSEDPVFSQEMGALHLHFLMEHKNGIDQVDCETSVIPYADLYKKGQPYV